MKLLILGAGGHGKVVREVAEAICDTEGKRIYSQIDFLDDNSELAIGKLSELERYGDTYECGFAAIGNNSFRKKCLEELKKAGFQIPILVHPTAYISPSAVLEEGTVVEPKASVNSNAAIKKGCIISIGAIVDHDVVVGECAHVNAGAICKAGSVIEEERKLEAGEVVKGY